MTAAVEVPPRTATLDELVRRAGALYSLPAVAVEVLRLTESPKVDVPALKDCIARDPALTVKLLRVVNSSLFGLSREVQDLNQALALLGIKPLKLLVLGFSLPDGLLLGVARDQLDWYWNTTLVRAVAAREISESLLRMPGDDGFLAGLLADLGVLVLLAELGESYAALLGEAMAAHVDLAELETRALGFTHGELTAALLDRWNMPEPLVRAISAPREMRQWAKNPADHASLVRTLHFADLLAQLVGQRRLNVLPDVLDVGAAYFNLDRTQLKELVAALEPKVQQLAGVLSLDESRAAEYSRTLSQAHDALAEVAESVAAQLSRPAAGRRRLRLAEPDGESLALATVEQLSASFDRYLNLPPETKEVAARPAIESGAVPAKSLLRLQFDEPTHDSFMIRLTMAAGHCRAVRGSLSLVSLALRPEAGVDSQQSEAIERLLDAACRDAVLSTGEVAAPQRGRRLLLLEDCDRPEAIEVARTAVEQLRTLAKRLAESDELPPCVAATGVASVTAPAKNFQAQWLLDAAQRCASAALLTGVVKSLEVS